MTLSGIFVDDQDQQYAKLLSTRDELMFEFVSVGPVLTLANRIVADRPAILALDYRLDENVSDIDPSETYKAGVLAQQLRDRASTDPALDLPIVLVSNEAKIQNLYRPDKTAHDLFDGVYRKEEIQERRPAIRREMIALAKGYCTLRDTAGKYSAEALLNRHGAGSLLQQQDITAAFGTATAPHTLAKFVLKALIDQPGLLVDDADAAARLGIDKSSFERLVANPQMQPIRYAGLFGEGWRRWWLDILLDWAEGILGVRPISLRNVDRAEKLSAALDLPLNPVPSPWTGRPDEAAALACASCREATEIRHSVAAYAPTALRFTLRPRICWDCIQTDRYRDRPEPLLVDEADAELAESVKTRQRDA